MGSVPEIPVLGEFLVEAGTDPVLGPVLGGADGGF